MYDKICLECGQPFQARLKTERYCNRPHIKTCEVCGKVYEAPKNSLHPDKLHYTCSRECAQKVKGLHKLVTQTCKLCGNEFQSYSERACYCPDKHYATCEVCGTSFEIPRSVYNAIPRTCSSVCMGKLVRGLQQNFDDGKKREIQQKMKQTCTERYGVAYYSQTDEFVKRHKQTCLDRYGVDSYTKTEEYIAKTKATSQKRYGADFYAETQDKKDKTRQTCLAKYGVDNPGKVGAYIVDKMSCPDKLEELMRFRANPKTYIQDNFTEDLPTLNDLSGKLGIMASSVGEYINRLDLKHLVRYTYSAMEDEVFNYLKSILPDDCAIERNTFKVIKPYELDIYLPDYKLGIECNPTITHNSSLPGFGSSDEPKSRGYHKMKSDMCKEKGIFLFHIFGYDWTHHKEVIKSMLANLLNCNEEKIFARNCEVRDVDYVTCQKFLSQNHRQGPSTSKIRIGLYHNDELVSLMTFGKMRNSIGTGNENLNNCYELLRFCSKLCTSVIGGADKLLKYFIKNYNPGRVRSFSDRAHTKGTLYSTLGFTKIRESDPGYVWVNLKTDQSVSRLNAQKQNIRKFLQDESLDLSRPETELMVSHGYVQVFDSGTITWEWRSTT